MRGLPTRAGSLRAAVRGARITALACALIGVGAATAVAESYPSADPYGDAADVALIVEGRVVGENRVQVVRVLFAEKSVADDAREIIVTGLSKHDRRVGRRDKQEGTSIDTEDVVLLLDRGKTPGEWRPHDLILEGTAPSERTIGGATGTFWLKDGRVWCYGQDVSPGPLVLMAWPPFSRLPGTADALRAQIAEGIAARRAWESDLATAQPAERARRLVRWLEPSTSPDGKRRTRRKYAVREVLGKMGSSVVPTLVGVLDPSHEDAAREEALATLADLGAAAKDAIPRLLEVAAEPGNLHRHLIAYSLEYAGDARAVPALRKLLAEAPLAGDFTAEYAAGGLVRLGDSEAADRISAKLPKSLDGLAEPYTVLNLVEALKAVDAARARAWLVPRAAHPLFRSAQDRVKGILGR